jgi:hypothetical protein
MSRYRLEVTLDDEQLAALDAARGHEPRASYVKRMLFPTVVDRAPVPAPAAEVRRGSMSPGLQRFMNP